MFQSSSMCGIVVCRRTRMGLVISTSRTNIEWCRKEVSNREVGIGESNESNPGMVSSCPNVSPSRQATYSTPLSRGFGTNPTTQSCSPAEKIQQTIVEIEAGRSSADDAGIVNPDAPAGKRRRLPKRPRAFSPGGHKANVCRTLYRSYLQLLFAPCSSTIVQPTRAVAGPG